MPTYASVLLLIALLSGCRGAGDGDATPSGREARSALPRESIVLIPRGPAIGKPRLLTGTFGSDAVEGGCGYLETSDGTRYEILYPAGWKLSRSPMQLLDPDGEVVARGGETVAVRGSEANDMVSICQIGPIFRATEVVSITVPSAR